MVTDPEQKEPESQPILRTNRRIERIIFGPRPMATVSLPFSASRALISADGRTAYAADERHGCLRRVVQTESGQVVTPRRLTKSERKAAKREHHQNSKRSTK